MKPLNGQIFTKWVLGSDFAIEILGFHKLIAINYPNLISINKSPIYLGFFPFAAVVFDTEVAFHPLEEEFDLPASLVELGNGEGGISRLLGWLVGLPCSCSHKRHRRSTLRRLSITPLTTQ